jgi:hypothetical protein
MQRRSRGELRSHKTSLTYNYGSDAGIVRSLPGKPRRRYVIAFLSNLGYRYGDAQFATSKTLPCFGLGACYTEKVAQLGKRVDDLLRGARPTEQEARRLGEATPDPRTGEARRRTIERTSG